MARRLQPTLMDYVVIAINPALIMVLITSLVYFLLEMFYQGEYPERLHFCLTMFVFAAVLIARISMEEGWERAAPFGIALAAAIALAMHQFVKYDGSKWEAVGWMINYSLIGLIWWCAIQLTWDCTLIDESQDASGEGLLQTVGLDGEAKNAEEGECNAEEDEEKLKAEGRKQKVESGGRKPDETAEKATVEESARVKAASSGFEDDMSWSSNRRSKKRHRDNQQPDTQTPGSKHPDTRHPDTQTPKSWWDKFLERRRRPHAPGVWVVYFSLAALPIFGFGQAFIPTQNTGSRRYSFVLLCVYVAAGLGLLMTTSFLGLRRYLRQRRLEMPLTMAGTWLVTGTVLIAAPLVLTMLLPRPNAEYAISQLPLAMGSAEHGSSQMSVGKEGTRDEEAKTASGVRSRPEKEQVAADQKEHGTGTGDAGENQSGAPASGKSDQGGGKTADGKEGQPQSGQAQNGKSDGGEQKSEQASGSGEKSNSSQAQSSQDKSNGSQAESGQEKSNGSQTAQSEKQQAQNSDQAKQESSTSSQENSQPMEAPQTPDLSAATEMISSLFKWVFYALVIGIALVWAWRHWEQLLGWLHEFLNGFGNLWGLLGRRERKPKDVIPPAPRHKSFDDYADPFASGAVGQYSPQELVRYSFEAFEAWARDNGWPREADQTAYEFARRVGGQAEAIAKPARILADLYSRAAYAPGTLPAASAEHLRALWETMRERQPVRF
jgi:hypothetical protein